MYTVLYYLCVRYYSLIIKSNSLIISFLFRGIQSMLLFFPLIQNKDAMQGSKKRQNVFPKERVFQMCSVICHPEERVYHHRFKKINELH